jgi:hypothetical protein
MTGRKVCMNSRPGTQPYRQINNLNNYLVSRNRDPIPNKEDIFLSSKVSGLALGPTQPRIQWLPGDTNPVVKQLRCDVDHSSSSSTKAKNEGSCSSIPPYAFTSCIGAILTCSRVIEGEHSTKRALHTNSGHDLEPAAFTFPSLHLFSKNPTDCYVVNKLIMKFERVLKRVRKKCVGKCARIRITSKILATPRQNKRSETKCGRGIRMNINLKKN